MARSLYAEVATGRSVLEGVATGVENLEHDFLKLSMAVNSLKRFLVPLGCTYPPEAFQAKEMTLLSLS